MRWIRSDGAATHEQDGMHDHESWSRAQFTNILAGSRTRSLPFLGSLPADAGKIVAS
jgi:hypothetical protein